MPSPALTAWSTSSAVALSQLQAAHHAVGGTRAGRRTNTLQLNYAYVLLLCAHFQAYCRGLHTNAAQPLIETIDPEIGAVLDVNLAFHRQLDRGNAQPKALGADFNRFDFDFWPTVEAQDARSNARHRKLGELNAWRNAIAHHDIDTRRADLHPHEVTLAACGSWHGALNGLARSFDRVLADRLQTLVGSRPW